MQIDSKSALQRYDAPMLFIERAHALSSTFSVTEQNVEAICFDGDLAPHQVFDVITELVDKSMLVADTAGRIETRYHLLETMREYAHEKLIASSEMDETRGRHLDYFVQFAEEAEPRLL